MRLSPLLPVRLRLDVMRVRAALRAVADGSGAGRPVFAARHSPADLAALNAAATAARADARAEASEARGVEVRVVAVERHGPDAVSLVLQRPSGDAWRFAPGQHVTLRLALDGRVVRRPYSLCSDPGVGETIAIGVKRVPGGLVSNHIVDNVVAGDVLEVTTPAGRFGTSPDPTSRRRVILVAGGSGITPLLSIARALGRAEPQSSVELIYANRGYQHVMFRDVIAALACSAPNVRVTHVLERPSRRLGGLTGRLEGDVLRAALPVDASAEYYVCGPAPMMDGVCAALAVAGVPAARVHVERFAAASRTVRPASGAVYSVTFARSGKLVQVPDHMTLLDAARDAGIAVPYSCALGGCGACAQRVTTGDVELESPNCLTDAERESGVVLCCVGRPRSAVVIDA